MTALQINTCFELLIKSIAVQHFKWNFCMICALKMQLLRSELNRSVAASSDLRGRLLAMENVRCYFYSHCARSD